MLVSRSLNRLTYANNLGSLFSITKYPQKFHHLFLDLHKYENRCFAKHGSLHSQDPFSNVYETYLTKLCSTTSFVFQEYRGYENSFGHISCVDIPYGRHFVLWTPCASAIRLLDTQLMSYKQNKFYEIYELGLGEKSRNNSFQNHYLPSTWNKVEDYFITFKLARQGQEVRYGTNLKTCEPIEALPPYRLGFISLLSMLTLL